VIASSGEKALKILSKQQYLKLDSDEIPSLFAVKN
jgi:hypothetical protein